MHRHVLDSLDANGCDSAASVLAFLHTTATMWDLPTNWQCGGEEEGVSHSNAFFLLSQPSLSESFLYGN